MEPPHFERSASWRRSHASTPRAGRGAGDHTPGREPATAHITGDAGVSPVVLARAAADFAPEDVSSSGRDAQALGVVVTSEEWVGGAPSAIVSRMDRKKETGSLASTEDSLPPPSKVDGGSRAAIPLLCLRGDRADRRTVPLIGPGPGRREPTRAGTRSISIFAAAMPIASVAIDVVPTATARFRAPAAGARAGAGARAVPDRPIRDP
jgi:hypothetical protein